MRPKDPERVFDLFDTDSDPPGAADAIARAMAQVFLREVRDPLTAIVFTHGITSLGAVVILARHVSPETFRLQVAFGWQTACGLVAAYAEDRGTPAPPAEPESAEEMITAALVHGDDHVIKVTEACLAHTARTGDPAFMFLPARARALL